MGGWGDGSFFFSAADEDFRVDFWLRGLDHFPKIRKLVGTDVCLCLTEVFVVLMIVESMHGGPKYLN
jgi:hypothetical protein